MIRETKVIWSRNDLIAKENDVPFNCDLISIKVQSLTEDKFNLI